MVYNIKLIIFGLIIGILSFYSGSNAADLRYNPMNDRFEYTQPGDVLKYNPMENDWSYENQNSSLRYNPMEDEYSYEY